MESARKTIAGYEEMQMIKKDKFAGLLATA
jgi:hypothetical protein